jgi:hypothetical protein
MCVLAHLCARACVQNLISLTTTASLLPPHSQSRPASLNTTKSPELCLLSAAFVKIIVVGSPNSGVDCLGLNSDTQLSSFLYLFCMALGFELRISRLLDRCFTAPILFTLVIFLNRVLLYVWASLDHNPIYASHLAGMTGTCHLHSAFIG